MFEPWEDEEEMTTPVTQKTVESQLDEIIKEIKNINKTLKKVLTQ